MKELHLLEQVRAAKIEKFKNSLSVLRKENRYHRQRIKELTHSREKWKQKYLAEKTRAPRLIREEFKKPKTADQPIARHQYSQEMIRICVRLYLFGNCSFRSVVRVLTYLQLELSLFLCEIPSKSTVENWVHKASYYHYQKIPQESPHWYADTDYAMIIDESMIVGKQKMLVILGVKASKEQEGALDFTQVNLLRLSISSSWTGEKVSEELEKVKEEIGKKPLYVIADYDPTLRKGIRKAGFKYLEDVSHKMARIYKHYRLKDPAFQSFLTACAQARYKGVMKEYAYLIPPRQRAKSRELNLYPIILWAKKMLKQWKNLSTEEQEAFGWLLVHKPIINRLIRTYSLTNECMKFIKTKGISHANIQQLRIIIDKHKAKHLAHIKAQLHLYLDQLSEPLPDEKAQWHACSDIIESFFGKYKQKKADNPFHGITILALSMGLYTENGEKVDIKKAMERTYLRDVKKWKRENLPDNQVIKRNKLLNR